MRIDLDRLEGLSTTLETVHSDFSNAEKLTDSWRDEVGHDGLADKLHDFSGNWDDTRANMLEGIANMAQLARDVAKAFRDADGELAKALTEAG